MYLRGEQLFERTRERERGQRARSPAHSGAEMQRNREKSGERKHFFCSAPVCDGEKSRKAAEKHRPCGPSVLVCVRARARELIKNLVVMINANYFFILAAESFAAQILLKINRMSGGARVFYEVLRARARAASPLSTRLSHAK